MKNEIIQSLQELDKFKELAEQINWKKTPRKNKRRNKKANLRYNIQ